jgi:hypothetical protein
MRPRHDSTAVRPPPLPSCVTRKNQAPRSLYNKFENVMTILKANGIRGLAGKNDWPRYTEEQPEMYE